MAKKEKKNIRKTKNVVSNNNRTYTNLEQYILTRNMEDLTNLYDRLKLPEEKGGKDEFQYRTFRQINGPGPKLINRLRGVDDLSVFYRIKTSTLSLLQPKIRLYKVTYENFSRRPNGAVDHSTIAPLPVPCYKEFTFSDNFGAETAASVEDYLRYE